MHILSLILNILLPCVVNYPTRLAILGYAVKSSGFKNIGYLAPCLNKFCTKINFLDNVCISMMKSINNIFILLKSICI
jgi:hypothetical protein